MLGAGGMAGDGIGAAVAGAGTEGTGIEDVSVN